MSKFLQRAAAQVNGQIAQAAPVAPVEPEVIEQVAPVQGPEVEPVVDFPLSDISDDTTAQVRVMLSIGKPVRRAQDSIRPELPIQTAVAFSPACLRSSTLTSESLPPPIGTRVLRGKASAGTESGEAAAAVGKRMRARRSILLW